MKFYHGTRPEFVESIERHGFRDGAGTYMTEREHSGVWLADRPLFIEITFDARWFEIEIDEAHLVGCEWHEQWKGYREWLVPADVLNQHGTRRLLSEEEAWDVWERFQGGQA